MKTTRRSIFGLLLALPLVSACSATPGGSPAHLEAAEAISNGKQLNGKQLNGILLNGMLLNGMLLNGTMINGKLLNGMMLNGKLLNGTLLGRLGSDALASLVGVADQLGAVDRNGATLGGARISHIDDGASFTLGCVEDAVGKCVRLGYEPWQTRSVCNGSRCQQANLSDWHQACTRMVRADYCGDGRSHTVDGTMINVYDGLGIQIDDEPWFFEAEWVSGGARCVTHQRVVDLTTVPGCAARLIDPTCGSLSHFASGTLLMDEYEVAPTSP